MRRIRTSGRGLRAGPSAELRAGFTLTELLIATAITLIFGAMAVATLRYGSGLWRSAHRRGYAYDMASFIFHQVEDDLNAAKPQYWSNDPTAFDTRVRFYVDLDRYYELNYGHLPDPDPTVGRHRLRFVRGIAEDTPNQLLRQAGDGLDNDGDGFIDPEYYTLKDDPIDTTVPLPDGVLDTFDGHVDEDLMPLEGMYEVAYLRGLDGTAGTGDAHTLYRGVLSPIGEPDDPWVSLPPLLSLGPALAATSPGYEGFNVTFFDGNYIGDADPPALAGLAAARIQAKAVPLAKNILHFEVRCWTQYTTTWNNYVPLVPWVAAPPAGGCGPALTWDSDRLAIDPFNPLPAAGPAFFMDWPAVGSPDDDGDGFDNSVDANYVRDNVFPRAIMVVVVADPSEEYPEPVPLTLAGPIAGGDMTIPVIGNIPAYNEAWPYILIQDPVGGDEWIRFSRFDSATSSFVFDATDPLAARGVRGTPAVAHAGTLPVKLGYTFSRVFFDPALREQ